MYMEEKKQKEAFAKKKNNKRFKTVLLAVITLWLLIKGAALQPQITDNHDKIDELNLKIAYEQKRAEEVDALKQNVDSDEYIEKIAREKLGMIRKDEIVFIDVCGEEDEL